MPYHRLEKLTLEDCVGNVGLAHLIDDCSELKEIMLINCNLHGMDGLISRRFNKLERLYIFDHRKPVAATTYDSINDATLQHFITSNPALIELSINGHFVLSTSRALRLIGQNLLKLHTLQLLLAIEKIEPGDFECIGQLQPLKIFQFHLNWKAAAPLAKALATNSAPITCLGIFVGSMDTSAIKYFSQLKQITSLQMNAALGLNDELVIELARKLPELKHLELVDIIVEDANDTITVAGLMQILHYAKKLHHMHFGFKTFDGDDVSTYVTIDTDDYKFMADTIRKRAEKISLHITLYDKVKLDADETVLGENRDILSIE